MSFLDHVDELQNTQMHLADTIRAIRKRAKEIIGQGGASAHIAGRRLAERDIAVEWAMDAAIAAALEHFDLATTQLLADSVDSIPTPRGRSLLAELGKHG